MKNRINYPIIAATTLLLLFGCNTYRGNLTYFFAIDNKVSSYTERRYIDDSTFIESKLSVRKELLQCCDTFRVVSNKMYYKKNGDFYPYFSKEAYLNSDTVYVFGRTDPVNKYFTASKFVPYATAKFKNKKVYGFMHLNSKEGEMPEDIYVVYFLPGFGIVQFKDHRSALSTIQVLRK